MKKLALALLLTCGTAQADDVAQVVALRGTVTANTIVLQQGSPINVGDRLIAEDKSELKKYIKKSMPQYIPI